MERRRFIIPMVIMASVVGIAVFVFFMFYKNVFIFKSQEEVQVSSAVPTAAAVYCTCGGVMTRSEYIAPTCTSAGSETMKCDTCGKTLEPKELPALGHDLIYYAAVEPAEGSEGNIEYWQCERCEKYFSDKDGTNEISYSDISIPYMSDSTDTDTDTDGMPLWQILLAVGSGILLLGVVAVLLDKFVFNADISGGK